MGLHEDLFDFDGDDDVDLDDDFMLMTMMDQLDGSNKSSSGSNDGCYIATCVYGSYDCPEVWTLRRFRDFRLAKSWLGRAFIHLYYVVSPTIVLIFGNMPSFQSLGRKVLNFTVSKLKSDGMSDAPYQDINWRKT